MTTRIKTIALASALALGTIEPAGAAFVKPATTLTTAAAAANAAALPADAVASYTTAAKKLNAFHAKQKKGGFFNRIARGIRRAFAGDNQIVAALLAFFLGGFGIHRFYLGYTTIGIIQLAMLLVGGLLSIVIIGLPILAALYIWVIIDFVRILTGDLGPKGGAYSETI